MCRCRPEIRTPFCGKENCQWPPQEKKIYKKLYLGCGPAPVHPQHLDVLGNADEWTFVDYYVEEPHIKKWDAAVLDEVPSTSVEHIYASHLLEHFEHARIPDILQTWHRKLLPGGKLTINVPDLLWAFKRLQRIEAGGPLHGSTYYDRHAGEHGVLSIIYGSQSHEGEYHKGGFTTSYLRGLLTYIGFGSVEVNPVEDAHDMGVLIATCRKSQ